MNPRLSATHFSAGLRRQAGTSWEADWWLRRRASQLVCQEQKAGPWLQQFDRQAASVKSMSNPLISKDIIVGPYHAVAFNRGCFHSAMLVGFAGPELTYFWPELCEVTSWSPLVSLPTWECSPVNIERRLVMDGCRSYRTWKSLQARSSACRTLGRVVWCCLTI